MGKIKNEGLAGHRGAHERTGRRESTQQGARRTDFVMHQSSRFGEFLQLLDLWPDIDVQAEHHIWARLIIDRRRDLVNDRPNRAAAVEATLDGA